MEKSKALFGTAESIVEQTRTKPTGMIAKRIKPTQVKNNKVNYVGKKTYNNKIKKTESFTK